MEDKRAEYSEDEIITLEFDEGDSFAFGRFALLQNV